MQAMVIASSLIRANNPRAAPGAGELDTLYPGRSQNLKDLIRVAAVLGALAFYVGALVVMERQAATASAIEAALDRPEPPRHDRAQRTIDAVPARW